MVGAYWLLRGSTMIGRYLDRGAEVGGDLPAVALDTGPDAARNPDELQFLGGVVYAIDIGLGGQGFLVERRLGGLRRDGHGGRLGQLLEGGCAADSQARGGGPPSPFPCSPWVALRDHPLSLLRPYLSVSAA
jgi:hypothetical protein